MKKIVIFIIAIIMIPMMADAQITKKRTSTTETIVSLRMGNMNLKKSGTTYFLAMGTDNQFDDYMLLILGDDTESAVQSLNDMIEICETITAQDNVVIDNGYGRELRIYKGVMGGISINADGYAGSVNTAKSEFRKMRDKLSSVSKASDQKFPDPLYK